MTEGSEPVANQLATMNGEQLLLLINQVHDLRAKSIAGRYGISAEADLSRLREAPDEDEMVKVAESIKADAEYAAFFPDGSPAFDDTARGDTYRQFFPQPKGN